MKDQRGVERIVLDTIQNHLPGDCGGTQVDIIIETRRGNRIPLEDALGLSSKEIKNIIFKDNGRGYDANYLGILKTGKENNKQAAGQFGEGLKMIASASLREGLDIGYKSRNWEAQADKRQIKIEGEDAEKLYFKVKEGDRSITGSQTHFSNITDSFWEEVRDIYDKVLFLRKNLQPLSQESDGSQVLDDHMGRIFVKGILLTDAYKDQLLFSYNLATDHINRDRNFVDNEQVQKDVKRLISNTSNKNLIAMILEKSHSKPTFMSEKSVFDKKEKKNFLEFQEMDVKYANIWREVFYKNYGGKAILDDGNNDQQKYDAEKLGYEPITLEYNIMKTLKKS
ncbi:MAG: hypothetical protein LBD11_00620 [Candidatus Peribacteria bacterium]|jgi:hypothetical protein|nr:hypothetical protein [Candidatus Peribacteria bacterium]